MKGSRESLKKKVQKRYPVPIRQWETPVPIPNTTVKTQAADGTILETIWESRRVPDLKNGGVAQLGEHLPCKQGVKSSNLSISSRVKAEEKDHRIDEPFRRFCAARTLKTAY